MKSYRDFDNDPNRFGYPEGEKFLQKLHDGGRHYVPIVDSALYIPNPHNASDAYVHLHHPKIQGLTFTATIRIPAELRMASS